MKLYIPNGKSGRDELKVLRGDPGPQGAPGPQGPPGKDGVDGKPGTATWAGITGKPAKFTPDTHKHTMAEISDLPEVSYLNRGQTIARRLFDGQIRVGDPTDGDHAATKKYVDTEVGKKADVNHTHSEYATKGDLESRIRLVSSAPSSPTAGVLYLVAE